MNNPEEEKGKMLAIGARATGQQKEAVIELTKEYNSKIKNAKDDITKKNLVSSLKGKIIQILDKK